MTKQGSQKDVAKNGEKKVEKAERLARGEIKVVAAVKLLLNYGKLAAKPGDVIILGPQDREQGVNLENLLKNGGVVPYESDEQALGIYQKWHDAINNNRPERGGM
tara:strand:+ start:1420 stop:1734 length:315 start_codon:yes stop_codon:yes gene_type:complete